jgi:RNA polymerase sigma-70 factor (ECF subfamily)
MSNDAARAAERVARQSYGKLIAFLAARSRDVPAAEDALSEALAAALRTWPERGVPGNPEAWLLVAARRNLSRQARHETVKAAAKGTVTMAIEEAAERMNGEAAAAFPDERLKLLFACTHPAIDRSVHTPLMLQTVLGIDARTIAQAFVVSADTMSQRLVRAKIKIREAHIPFIVPDRDVLCERLAGVLSAIYAGYGIGWDGLDGKRNSLAEEAIWLGRSLLSMLPDEAEAMGLLSLMLYSESRRAARRDPVGRYVPLDEQDPVLWNAIMIAEAAGLLRQAGRQARFGPFQCQAAIQAVHAERRRSGAVDWAALKVLYEALIQMAPTLGAFVSRAAVVARADGAEAALVALDTIPQSSVAGYQPYWAVRAHVLAALGDRPMAIDAYRTAIGLSDSDAVRTYLQDQFDRL